MGADTVEEPAVVADDDSTTGKVLQALFKCTQGVDINVVSGLVKQQYVALLLEAEGQMEAIAFTS